jgi:biotin carboxyl carrier protein
VARDRARDEQELRRVADELLPPLIARFGASRLGELEIRRDGWRIRLRRDASSVTVAAAGTQRAGDGRGEPRTDARRAAPPAGGERQAGGARTAVGSPAVGYYQPVDGLDVGRRVRAGDLLGHVDMLGVRHEVVAAGDGVVGRVLAQAGEAVEYAQELVRIDRLGARGGDTPLDPAPDGSATASADGRGPG